jgi:hypothetical protein
MSQVGDLLMTMTNAINTFRQLRNVTAVFASGAHPVADPQPISDAPFSVRVLRVVGSGGPTYDWKAATTVVGAPNVTVDAAAAAAAPARVRFATKYTREVVEDEPYTLRGQVELRNTQPRPVKIEVRLWGVGTRRAGPRRQAPRGGWPAGGRAGGCARQGCRNGAASVQPRQLLQLQAAGRKRQCRAAPHPQHAAGAARARCCAGPKLAPPTTPLHSPLKNPALPPPRARSRSRS